MKILQFNKKTWHYKLVSYTMDEHHISDNFCGYFWSVICCMIGWSMCISFLITLFYIMILSPLIYLAVVLQYGLFEASQIVVGGVTLDLILLFGMIFFYTFDVWIPKKQEERRKRNYEKMLAKLEETPIPTPPGFIVTAWRTFKYKTCFKIEFK